jgi:hypothetical protein
VVLATVYAHLALRLSPEWGIPALSALVLGAAVSYAVQQALADFYGASWSRLPGASRLVVLTVTLLSDRVELFLAYESVALIVAFLLIPRPSGGPPSRDDQAACQPIEEC